MGSFCFYCRCWKMSQKGGTKLKAGERPKLSLNSRSKAYRKRHLHEKLKKSKGTFKMPVYKAPESKEPAVYPAYDEKHRLPSRRGAHRAPSVRASLSAGVIVILLSGKYRGKRVVVLDVLPSGLLMVTGPYRLNGVPVRRVNPAYVIATSTRLDISKVKVSDKFNDAYFTKPKTKKVVAKKGEAEAMFAEKKSTKTPLTADQLAAQKDLDNQLLPLIKATPLLSAYLRKPFSLSNGQRPHEMTF